MATSINLVKRLYGSFGIMLGLLVILLSFSVWNYQELEQANRWNIHTYKVLLATHSLMESIVSEETSIRGFIVTNENSFLGPYNNGKIAFQTHWKEASTLTKDRPDQQKYLEKLQGLQQQWVTRYIEPLIVTRRRIPDDLQVLRIAKVDAPKRKVLMDTMRATINSIEATETNLLHQRESERLLLQTRTRLALWCGGLFSLVLAIVLIKIVINNTHHLNATNRQLAGEIEERRQAEEKLSQAVKELEHSNTELGRSNAELEQFAYVASHDLQEPLRAVSGCVQILQRRYSGQLDARAEEFIRHAVEGAQRMQTLINDLLAYSRVGTHGKAFELVDAGACVATVLSSLRVAVQESGVEITQDPMPKVWADEGQLSQVFQNLLTNAMKFRRDVAPKNSYRLPTHYSGNS